MTRGPKPMSEGEAAGRLRPRSGNVLVMAGQTRKHVVTAPGRRGPLCWCGKVHRS